MFGCICFDTLCDLFTEDYKQCLVLLPHFLDIFHRLKCLHIPLDLVYIIYSVSEYRIALQGRFFLDLVIILKGVYRKWQRKIGGSLKLP